MTTREASASAGTTVLRVRHLLTTGRLEPPPKNGSGDYDWTPEDVERLKVVAPDGRRKASALTSGPEQAA
jgi:hypothetical protein